MSSSNENAGLFRAYRFPKIPYEDAAKDTGKDSGDFRKLTFDKNGLREYPEEIARKTDEAERLAYAKGFSKGEEAGILAGQQKMEPTLNALADLLAELSKIRDEILQNAEKEAVELALAISEKVIAREASTNTGVITSVVREALKDVVDQDKITVRLNPDDVEFILGMKHEFSNLVRKIEQIAFEPDETVGRGGCYIETNFGDIDARIEQKIELVTAALRNEFKNR